MRMSEVEIKHTTFFSHMIIPNTNKTQIRSQIRKPLLNLPLIGVGSDHDQGGSLFKPNSLSSLLWNVVGQPIRPQWILMEYSWTCKWKIM